MQGQHKTVLKKRTCFNCQRRKIHCDKQERCSRCIQDKVACTYPVSFTIRRNRPSSRAAVAARLEHLEQALSSALDSPVSPMGAASLFPAQFTSFHHQNAHPSSFCSVTPDLDTQAQVKEEDQVCDNGRTKQPTEAGTSFIEQLLFQSTHPSEQTILELSTHQRHELWSIFAANFDLLIKVLHKPTTQHLFDNEPETPETLVLVNAICLAAVTSLDDEECYSRLGHPRKLLLSLYKSATEVALTRAELLTTSKLEVHQAFVLYICSVATHSSVNLICTMARMAVNLARFHSFHRDGSTLGLSPFETEMRRRLWWLLICMDLRYSEESDFSTVFAVYLDDAQIPLNVNDRDLDPTMTALPPSRKGFTEMSLSLMRIEMAVTWQQVRLLGCAQRYKTPDAEMVDHRDQLIKECEDRIKNSYIYYDFANASAQHLNEQTNICRNIREASDIIFQFVSGKFRVFAATVSGSESAYQNNDPEWALDASIRMLELYVQFCQSGFATGWNWFFRSYPLWHTLFKVLSHLCRERPDARTSHAWQVIDALHDARLLSNMAFAGDKVAKAALKLRDEALARRVHQTLAGS